MRPRPIPRKTAAGAAAADSNPGASMRPRPIPRKTEIGRQFKGLTEEGFNEAAADTAENDPVVVRDVDRLDSRFNEAAADTAENGSPAG